MAPLEQQPRGVLIDDARIYDVLLEVRDQGRETGAKVDALGAKVDDLVEDKKDHEARLRALEKRKAVAPWQLWTAVTTGAAFIGVLIGIFKAVGGL